MTRTRVHNQGFTDRLPGSKNLLKLCANLCAHMHFPGEKSAYFYGVFSRALDPKMFRTIYLHSNDLLRSHIENIPGRGNVVIVYTLVLMKKSESFITVLG